MFLNFKTKSKIIYSLIFLFTYFSFALGQGLKLPNIYLFLKKTNIEKRFFLNILFLFLTAPSQVDAMNDLKNALNLNSVWNNPNFCFWNGVTCDGSGFVTSM